MAQHNPLKSLIANIKKKPPPELVSKMEAAFAKTEADGNAERTSEDLSKYFIYAKAYLFGTDEQPAHKETAVQLVQEASKTQVLWHIVVHLNALPFETKKDATQVFGAIVKAESNGQMPGTVYIHNHPEVLHKLFQGFDNPDIALFCGQMLRDAIRQEPLAKLILTSSWFFDFFDKVEVSNFEVASDAFTTLKDLLTRHKAPVAAWLGAHYEQFFAAYTKLLKSENYVTRRQSLKLLGELLLDRPNVKVMMRYVSEVANLILMMNLLRDASRSIQFEAFHVFKVFVANPNKTEEIVDILASNKEKLVKYLGDFQNEKDDEQFREEKAVIIKEISTLQPKA